MTFPPNPNVRKTADDFFPRWEKYLRFGWVGAAVVVVAVGFGFWKRSRPEVYVPEVHFTPVKQWTSDPSLTVSPIFSHSQKFVAYASDRNGAGNLAIWIKPYPSGEARRLTNEPFNNSDPDLSPDESQIVYRSERDGGGIYIAPVSGATGPRLLARGLRPRFSPDGKWIAYYDVTSDSPDGSPAAFGRIFIVSPGGGTPVRIRADFARSLYPVWAPDSQHILFDGSSQEGWRDWWVTPIDGSPAKATQALEILRRITPTVQAPERWVDGKVLFSATEQEHLHLWEIAISPQDWRASHAPRQLTQSAENDQVGTIGRDGRLMFTRMHVSQDLWSLPLDANRGLPAGELQQITDDNAVDQAPSITPDGAKLLYISNKTGIRDIWIRNSGTGVEEAVTAYSPVGYRPSFSRDGTRVAYPTTLEGRCAVQVRDLGPRPKTSTLQGCFNIYDWSRDGSNMLIYTAGDSVRAVDLFKAGPGARLPLLAHPSLRFFDASFSPDGRWIAFTVGVSPTQAQVYVARFRETPIPEAEWIAITGRERGGFSAWSPDGGLLYFHSNRDGFPCIWAQKLDGANHPSGPAIAVKHFHAISLGTYLMRPSDFRMSVSKDLLVLNLIKQTANLWVTTKSE